MTADADRPAGVREVCPFCNGPTDRPVRPHGSVVSFEPLNPITPGHLLVVPKAHVRDLTDSPTITAKVFAVAAVLAREAWPCNVITSAGAEATQTVFHLHVHVVPRRAGDGLLLPWTTRDHPEVLSAAGLAVVPAGEQDLRWNAAAEPDSEPEGTGP